MNDLIKTKLLELNRAFYAEMASAFDHKRQGTPPGLERLLDYIPKNQIAARVTILDVGCGNGRFARILDKLGLPFFYVGIDRSDELLKLAADNVVDLVNGTAVFQQVDLIAPDWSVSLKAKYGEFDVVLCTAVLHHLPSYELRLDVVRQICALTRTTVILSSWQFLTSERFVKKCLPWSEIGLTEEQIKGEIEKGDALLPWKHERYMIRYVHQVDEGEFQHLASDVEMPIVDRFYSDGKEGNLSFYAVLQSEPSTVYEASCANIMDTRTESLIEQFEQHYGEAPTSVAIAPGRVNLIGEHTDYNDGFVLPIALQRDVRIVLKPRGDQTIRLLSADYDSDIQFDISSFEPTSEMHWSNYVKGMVWALQQLGVSLMGFDGIVAGNVPKGSGLSSSAAFEVAMGKALLESSALHGQVSGVELAKAAQSAENNFVGVNCGIMDQFISVLGAEDHALLIDCRSLEYRLVSVPTNVSIVIGNTKASRSLADSAYNERRAQCEEGVTLLQQKLPSINALRDVTSQQLEEHRDLLSPIVYQRCRHVVSENERVMEAVKALESGDLSRTGQLMSQSHNSLRDDYAVSSEALDVMVNLMESAPGCYGARLTGAGFGGCTVALVDPGHEQAVADIVYEGYSKVTNIWPEVYTTQASAGSRVAKI